MGMSIDSYLGYGFLIEMGEFIPPDGYLDSATEYLYESISKFNEDSVVKLRESGS